MSDVLLEIRDLQLSFGGVPALDHLDLTVTDEYAFWGIIGPNGSGKSTLFNVISGLYQADAGTVSGSALARSERGHRRGVGRTFQHPRAFTGLSVRENLLAGSVGLRRAVAEQRTGELLGLLRLERVAHRRAGELSIGQQKLVELARALMTNPRIVLLDEVAAGIHPDLRQEIAEHLRTLAELGTRFLMIEHDMTFLMGLCSRVFCVANGRTIAAGSPAEIRRNETVVREYLGVTRG